MNLTLRREPSFLDATLGGLYIGSVWECHTVEDVIRPSGEKVMHKTAIPAGTYEIDITPSVRFKRDLPILLNVPNFTGIRIHPGNSAEDSSGCILPGRVRTSTSTVGESRLAFEALYTKLKEAKARGEKITIEVLNP